MHRPVRPHLTKFRALRFDMYSVAQGGLAFLIAYAIAYAVNVI